MHISFLFGLDHGCADLQGLGEPRATGRGGCSAKPGSARGRGALGQAPAEDKQNWTNQVLFLSHFLLIGPETWTAHSCQCTEGVGEQGGPQLVGSVLWNKARTPEERVSPQGAHSPEQASLAPHLPGLALVHLVPVLIV